MSGTTGLERDVRPWCVACLRCLCRVYVQVVLLTKEMFGNFTRENEGNYYRSSNLPRMSRANIHAKASPTPVQPLRKNLLDFMMSLRTGTCNGVRVRLGRLSEMVNTSMIESLDFLVSAENGDIEDWHKVLKTTWLSIKSGGSLGLPGVREPKVSRTRRLSGERRGRSPVRFSVLI